MFDFEFLGLGFHVFELLTWLEDEPTDVFVVNLKTGHTKQFETKPTYSAHHANAYENEKEELIVDISPTPYVNLRDYLALKNQLNPPEESTGVFTTDDECTSEVSRIHKIITGKKGKKTFTKEDFKKN